MVGGCLAAIDRLVDAVKDPAGGADATFVPLFEALNWAASIDLYYDKVLEAPLGNATLRGVRFARNRAHHDWALALERQDWPGPGMTIIQAPGRRRDGS
jgi:hypothetical protein